MADVALFMADLALGLLLGCVFAVIAHGLNLIWGVAKVVNVAHGEFIMLGAYGAYFLSIWLGFNPLLSVPIEADADRQSNCGINRYAEERIEPEPYAQEVRTVRAEHDELAVSDVHDFGNAPDEVQAMCDDRKDAAEQEAEGEVRDEQPDVGHAP